jgi:hypothetical protein
MSPAQANRALRRIPLQEEWSPGRRENTSVHTTTYATEAQTVFGFAPRSLTRVDDELGDITLSAVIETDVETVSTSIPPAEIVHFCNNTGEECFSWYSRSLEVSEGTNSQVTHVACRYEYGEF